MKRKTITLFVMMAIIFIFNMYSFAEARSIYIGDDIVLKLENMTLTQEDIELAFKDFHIDDMHRIDRGYEVTLSPLFVGKQTINLKDQEIIIDVKSTLDEIDREGIFEMDLQTGSALNPNLVYVLLLISGGTVLVTHGIYLINRFKKKHVRSYTPYERFLQTCEKEQGTDKSVLGEMTKASKLYLSAKLNQPMIGLTTDQLSQVSIIDKIDPTLMDVYIEWLRACDALKYQECFVLEQEVINMKQNLLSIVEDLENYFIKKEGSVAEDAI